MSESETPNVSNLIQSPDGRTSVVTNNNEIRAQLDDANVLEATNGNVAISSGNDMITLNLNSTGTGGISNDSELTPGVRAAFDLHPGVAIASVTTPDNTTNGVVALQGSMEMYSSEPNPDSTGNIRNSLQITPTTATLSVSEDGNTSPFIAKQPADIATKQYVDSQPPAVSSIIQSPDGACYFQTSSNLGTGVCDGGDGNVGHIDIQPHQISLSNRDHRFEITESGVSLLDTDSAGDTPFIAQNPSDIATKQYVDAEIGDRAFTRNPDGSIILSVLNDEGVLVGSLSIGASGHGIFTANESFGITSGGNSIGVDRGGVRLNRINFTTEEIMRLKELAGTKAD